MSTIAIPELIGLRGRKSRLFYMVPGAVLLGAVLLVGGKKYFSGGPAGISGTFQPVTRMDLDVRVSKDGELAAVNNIDVLCLVEGSTTITQLIKEGTFVKKGDLLVKLDSSGIEQRIEDTTMSVQQAEADLATANELKLIQESQNSASLEAAEVALQLARIDLQQYTEGTYPQSLIGAQTDLDMAQVTVKNQQEAYDQIQKLYEQGFVTTADVKKAELDVRTAQVTLRKAQTALDVLTQYSNAMNLAMKKNTLVQSEANMTRVQRQNAAAMSQQIAGVTAKAETLDMQKRRLDKLKEQLADCTITAPADGLVVYGSSGDRWSSVQIQEGAQVRERQLVLRLPDTASMKSVVRVPEAMVSKLAVGQRAEVRIVGNPKPLMATLTKISVLSDASSRFWNPDLKEYPVDLTLDTTPVGLKPGVGTMCDIYVNRLKDVIAVPLTAVYSAGKDTYVFVHRGLDAIPVKISLGKTNETHAEVTSGLDVGQSVLLLQAGQGRELLEKAGIKIVEDPTTKPAAKMRHQRAESPAKQSA
ncbi:MAG TPA: HlyD family efflux transporter periplasmic adaptor subunit [Tepidisphaeraceae bacterium]|jgi:multidrug efflux pump subunit AcrA (membrane-fusion protein)|nr:HlyD family efflux transporter periplasmic adaptor subunit [Tepidisphaeraceae bacterium]